MQKQIEPAMHCSSCHPLVSFVCYLEGGKGADEVVDVRLEIRLPQAALAVLLLVEAGGQHGKVW